ncbi:GntR family transcriptional regulator, transcriptional repressor for pyruvate dehydrogenase complex [Seinonella peptonophila]|uniref:GntR family transcriptional regulator, transcriptional repressor for pyruvate dehydrogenase complex n=1 Tax=Seinonella peptonophila TaxID=112248 RepID=A0A1M4Y848_9BACL|nr:FadR/GntR family transcriptional regulator [Seinonella peptonophila]SHF01763.1 GntR family transcriptional regulator, transcriptional repressor for pyruvate dehydrogenase complex [Seinonella peptonophila]
MDLENLNIKKREPLALEITNQIIEYLQSGKVNPGDRLPSERQLAQNLGVGRSVVRDALKSLSLLGILEIRQGDGTYFQSISSELLPRTIEWGLLLGKKRVLDLAECRHYIEIAIVKLAAERRDQQTIEELSALLETMKNARFDTETFAEADLQFHMKIAKASQNTALHDILSSMRSLLDFWIKRVIAAAGDSQYSYDRHLAIFEAIKEGDAQKATKAMEKHMESALERLKTILKENQKDQA